MHSFCFQEELIERVKPLYYTRMRLGEFDPPTMNPYSQLNLSEVQSPQHRHLALYTAMQSFVLLKNDGVLPVKSTFKTVAVCLPIYILAHLNQRLRQSYCDWSLFIELNFMGGTLVAMATKRKNFKNNWPDLKII